MAGGVGGASGVHAVSARVPPATRADWEATEAEANRLEELAAALETFGVSLPCQRPVRMLRHQVNEETGGIDPAGKEFLLRCNNRRASVCPSCAALYKGDVSAIMRAGIHAAQAAGEEVVFLTLTAPSFGPTHYVPPTPPPRLNRRSREQWDRRHRRRCRCGDVHSPGDRRFLGVPASPEAYDYDAQVRWNAGVGRLWSRTADELTRVMGCARCGG